MSSPFGNIEVRGARENNLKNISLDVPRRQITVFTGVSGSGKSSLVFDTIAAESQRLINETFSTFVQMFLPRYGQPDADALHNLSTAIIVDQQPLGGNPRSTLGTATDVFTMFRVLFACIGSPKVPHALALSFNDPRGMCPECEGLAWCRRSTSMRSLTKTNHWPTARSSTRCSASAAITGQSSRIPVYSIRRKSYGTTAKPS